MTDRRDPEPRRLGVAAALVDAGFAGLAGRRLVSVYYSVSLVLTALFAAGFVLVGVLAVIGGSSLGWLAIVIGPLVCLVALLATRLWLEVAAARFDTRDEVVAIRRHLESSGDR